MSLSLKGLICCAIAGGVTYCPHVFYSTGEIPKVKKSLKLGKTVQGKINLSLSSINNIEQLLNGTKKRLEFKEIGMKFGDKNLSPHDILFSPCQDENYYLLKAISFSKNQYQFENGVPSNQAPSCREKSKYQNLNSISLDWTKKPRSNYNLSSITVGSCFLSKVDDKKKHKNPKLKISCSQFLGNGRGEVHGEFGDDNYEY